MKKWKERGKRIAVLLLTAALVGSSVDLSALTVNAAEEEKTLTCEKEEHTHDDSCIPSRHLPILRTRSRRMKVRTIQR